MDVYVATIDHKQFGRVTVDVVELSEYQQLMEKAVRFAQSVVDYDPYHDGKLKKEARALLKEREGT